MFFFNGSATTEIYTLSLHDALPICLNPLETGRRICQTAGPERKPHDPWETCGFLRSEEHTSELQSQSNLVCRLLLEKKNNASSNHANISTAAISHTTTTTSTTAPHA